MSALEAVLAHLHGQITTEEALFWIEAGRPTCDTCGLPATSGARQRRSWYAGGSVAGTWVHLDCERF